MKTIATDRSRIETAQHCKRERFLTYHQDGTGITSARKPLPLAVGGSVHRGLEILLRGSMGRPVAEFPQWIPFVEDAAVDVALADFATHKDGGLELDLTERTAMEAKVATEADAAVKMREELSASLGMTLEEAGLEVVGVLLAERASKFEDYLYAEQSALVEALVRAYARRRLRPLLDEFEVLEVEREGEWELTDGIWFLSRPDALLRSRIDNSLYLQSYKTAASWDIRKERDAQHDMQGLSEGIEVEKRLGEWWELLHKEVRPGASMKDVLDSNMGPRMAEYLHGLPAPPRVLGIRYEYLLKSYRGEDKDLSREYGMEVRSQRSHLIRQYVAVSTPKTTRSTSVPYNVGDVCWSYDYIKEDGETSKLAWQNWKSRPVWNEPGGVKAWIDALDQSAPSASAYDSTIEMDLPSLGYRGPAQAMGFTATHPLDDVFIPPVTVYRNDDDLRDLVEQMEAQERGIAEGVALVDAAVSADERRSLLNQHFPQTRRACEYPSTCAFVKVCYGGEELRANPLDSGLYRRRIPNHPRESELGSPENNP